MAGTRSSLEPSLCDIVISTRQQPTPVWKQYNTSCTAYVRQVFVFCYPHGMDILNTGYLVMKTDLKALRTRTTAAAAVDYYDTNNKKVVLIDADPKVAPKCWSSVRQWPKSKLTRGDRTAPTNPPNSPTWQPYKLSQGYGEW